jgi:hypothetical protein
MFIKRGTLQSSFFILIAAVIFLSGCIKVKNNQSTPTLLKTEDASQEQLLAEINRYARVASMRAKVGLKFEDNSFAQFGS